MKKWLVIGVTILVVALGASYVFAATPETPTTGNGGLNVEQMMDACKQMVNNFVNDGTLSPDQGKAMNDQMNTMAPMMKDRMGQGTNQGMPCDEGGKTK